MKKRMKHAQNVRSELTNPCKDKQDVFPVAQTSPPPLMEQWKSQTVLVMSSIFCFGSVLSRVTFCFHIVKEFYAEVFQRV